MIRPLAILLALGLAAPALAQATADLDAVDRAVAQFTGAPLGQPGGAAMPTDRRLRLAPCRGRQSIRPGKFLFSSLRFCDSLRLCVKSISPIMRVA